MLNLRNSSVFVVVLLMSAYAFALPWWVFLLIIVAYLWLLVSGSMRIHSQFYTKVICAGSTDKKSIALSFDDGPSADYTAAILDSLRQAGAPAVFFCIGQRVKENPLLAKRIVDDGHLIGNHSYTHHALIDLYSTGRLQKELTDTNAIIKETTGKLPRYFRPPYGVTNPNLAAAIKTTRMTTIGWNIRSLDTVAKSEERLLEKLWKELQPGSIVLFHDTMAITSSILPRFIEGVKQKGFEIVPIDQLINEDAYA